MTVQELIVELRKYPSTSVVKVWGTTDDDGSGTIQIEDVGNIEID